MFEFPWWMTALEFICDNWLVLGLTALGVIWLVIPTDG